MRPILEADLDHIMAHTTGLWEPLRGQSIFMTGGTGLFGKWLTASFCRANDRLGLGACLYILTRDPSRAQDEATALYRHSSVVLVPGDLRSFAFPDGEFPHVIHAATATKPNGEQLPGWELFEPNLAGTRRLLDFAAQANTKRLLYVSSGAVYGPQPIELHAIPDEYVLAPETKRIDLAYGHSKRVSEFLIFGHANRYRYAACAARCFAFVGPLFPIEGRYAIGNFIRDALKGGPIRVNSGGAAVRSYLYLADLAIWLWTLLLRGRGGETYNVGSPHAISIGSLAKLAATIINPDAEVIIGRGPDSGFSGPRYVPDTTRAFGELGMRPWIDLPEAITRTANWYRGVGQ